MQIVTGFVLWALGMLLLAASLAQPSSSAEGLQYPAATFAAVVLQGLGIALFVSGIMRLRRGRRRVDASHRQEAPVWVSPEPVASPAQPAADGARAPLGQSAPAPQPTFATGCARCGTPTAEYTCRRCGQRFCRECLDQFASRANAALQAHVDDFYGSDAPITLGKGTFDSKGRALCPACYGTLLAQAMASGNWDVLYHSDYDSDVAQREPSIYPDPAGGTGSTASL